MGFSINYKEPVDNLMVEEIVETYEYSDKKELVIVCIGTDKSIGDSVGPLVGTKLLQANPNLTVYGTIHEPMHALNIHSRLDEINDKHKDAYIIAVDACLGSAEDIGKISLRDFGISPGKGVGKDLPNVGDCSMIGIIHESDVLFGMGTPIRMSFIFDVADKIVETLLQAIEGIEVTSAINAAALTTLHDNELRSEYREGGYINGEEIF